MIRNTTEDSKELAGISNQIEKKLFLTIKFAEYKDVYFLLNKWSLEVRYFLCFLKGIQTFIIFICIIPRKADDILGVLIEHQAHLLYMQVEELRSKFVQKLICCEYLEMNYKPLNVHSWHT